MMKTKYNLFFILFLILSFTASAQVKIGEEALPAKGALLDLNVTKTAEGEYYLGGLLLPNVAILDLDYIPATFTDASKMSGYVTDKGVPSNAALKGSIVYNTHTDTGKNITPGIYVWDGNAWHPLIAEESAPTLEAELGAFSAAGETKAFEVVNSGCTAEGVYSAVVIAGSAYAFVTPGSSAAGEFKLTFAANSIAFERTAAVLVYDPCGNSTVLLFRQAGNTFACDPLVNVPDIASYGSSATLCAGGAVYLYLDGNIGNNNPDDYIWVVGQTEVGRGASHTATRAGNYTVYYGTIGCANQSEPFFVSYSESSAPAGVEIRMPGEDENVTYVCDEDDETTISTLTSVSGTVHWFKDGVLQAGKTGESITAGIGRWQAVVGDDGCWSKPSSSIFVEIDPNAGVQIANPIIYAGGSVMANGSFVCRSSSLHFSTGGFSGDYDQVEEYYWSAYYPGESEPFQTNPRGITINVTEIPAEYTSFQIVCEAEAKDCLADASSSVIVYILPVPEAPVITGNDLICDVYPKLTAVLPKNAEANGYIWYLSNGTDYMEIKNANENYTISPTYFAQGYTFYQVTYIDNETGCESALSEVFSVTKAEVPVIILPTETQTMTVYEEVPFSLSISVHCSEEIDYSITATGTDGSITYDYDSVLLIDGEGILTHTFTPERGGYTSYTWRVWNKDCSSTASNTAQRTTNVTIAPVSDISEGTGSFVGKQHFDVVYGNDNTNGSEPKANRYWAYTNFALTTVQDNPAAATLANPHSRVQKYTFTAPAGARDVQFIAISENNIVDTYEPDADYSGNQAGEACKVTVTYLNLNTTLRDRAHNRALTCMIHAVYTDSNGDWKRISLGIRMQDASFCGAYVDETTWLPMMCHNLGADISLNPFVPAAGIHGAKYKFGTHAPVMTQSADQTNYTYPGGLDEWLKLPHVHSWDPYYDPCPDGWRLPTKSEWQGIVTIAKENTNKNTPVYTERPWTEWNYNAGVYLKSDNESHLYYPAAGERENTIEYDHPMMNQDAGNTRYLGTRGYAWHSDEERSVFHIRINGSTEIFETSSENVAGRALPVRCVEGSKSFVHPGTLPIGSGSFTGKTLFDLGSDANDNSGGCEDVDTRTWAITDFDDLTEQDPNGGSLPGPHSAVQVYTFSAPHGASNLRFVPAQPGKTQVYDIVKSIMPKGGFGDGNTYERYVGGKTCKVTVTYDEALKTSLVGRNRDNPLKYTLYAVYYDGSKDVAVPLDITLQDCSFCGAYTSGTTWKPFMCHNLGADTSYDPFVPRKEIHGDKYRFGVASPSLTRAQDQASNAAVSGWSSLPIQSGSSDWSDTNNPCPTGWRLPTTSEWIAIYNNALNVKKRVGTWHDDTSTTYTEGYEFGSRLFFPASGARDSGGLKHAPSGNRLETWNKTANSTQGTALSIHKAKLAPYTDDDGIELNTGRARDNGIDVRCIKD